MEQPLGRHLLVEFYDCDADALDNLSGVEASMLASAEAAGATIIQSDFHRFQPYGISGVVVIAESHLAIHTWPEYGYAAVDLFTCGAHIDPMRSFIVLKEAFGAERHETHLVGRGFMPRILGTPVGTQDDKLTPAPVLEMLPLAQPKRHGGVR